MAHVPSDPEAPTASSLEGGPAGGPPAPLAPGTLLGGRYRIVRFVAQGGMGAVYEAEDGDLRQRVALKVLRPDLAADEAALERFRREILLARKVTHPNVCRVFDLGRHEGLAFLSMELLSGETLAERLRRGRLGADEALPLVRQIVDALAAAHAAGVVHRDFKPANVVLVPLEGGGVRVVVMDFGLALASAQKAGEGSSLTGAGITVGTAAYMAPEQVEGGRITPAADIYALGVVLYEMVTGTRPFAGTSPLSTAVKRLTVAPPPPRSLVADLDPRWEAVILRCLGRRPEQRFASVTDVARALLGERVARGGGRPWAWGVAAGLAAVALGAGAYRLAGLRRPAAATAQTAAAAPARPSIAVLSLRNTSGRPDAAWLSTALAEMLTTELAAGEHLRTVPGETIVRVESDLPASTGESLAADSLLRIRSRTGSDFVVLGSYVALGGDESGRIRVDLRLQDAARGDTVAALAEEGTEADLFALVSRAGTRLRERLGVGALSPDQAGAVRAALPSSPTAARAYAEGLARLRLFDALAARELLGKAVAEDPRSALAHAALAEAWRGLGYEREARVEARKAFDLAAPLSREDRLSVEGRYREAAREWDKATEIYRTLYGFFSDNVDYGLSLAAAQTAGGRGQQALETLDSLRKLQPPASGDPRIDLASARAAAALSDFRGQRAFAAHAARAGRAQGARLLTARARLEEASALVNLGELDEAARAAEAARTRFAEVGDRGGVADALLELQRARWQQGRLAEATRAVREALAAWRAIGNRSREARALNSLAVNLHYLGELAEARRGFDAALAAFRELGDRSGIAIIAINTARLLRDQGDLAGAHRQHDLALALCDELGNRNYKAHALFGVGETLAVEGRLEEAQKAHEDALGIWKGLGRQGPVGESHAMLATLLIDLGRPAEAEGLAREAVAEFQQQKSAFNETHAQAVLTLALLAQGKRGDARAAAARAAALAGATEHRVFRLQALIAADRVWAASGERERAVGGLTATLAEARRSGLPALELEARLALGEIEAASGRVAAARAHLAKLEREARSRGFALISRRAAAALSSAGAAGPEGAT